MRVAVVPPARPGPVRRVSSFLVVFVPRASLRVVAPPRSAAPVPRVDFVPVCRLRGPFGAAAAPSFVALVAGRGPRVVSLVAAVARPDAALLRLPVVVRAGSRPGSGARLRVG